MHRGYRNIFAALVGWLILTAATQKLNEKPGTAKSNQVQRPTAHAQHIPLYSDRCYRSQNHETAGLCAQWRAVFAAEKTAREAGRATNWAIIASALSALALAGLFYSLRQTNKALQLARNSAYTELRSYLYPGIFKIEALSGSSWRCFVPLINGGQTPARDVKPAFQAKVVPYPLRPESVWEIRPGNVLYTLLGPRADRQINAALVLNVHHEAEIVTKKACVLAQLKISYTTYSGEEIEEPAFMAICTGHDFEKQTMKIVTPRFLEQMFARDHETKA